MVTCVMGLQHSLKCSVITTTLIAFFLPTDIFTEIFHLPISLGQDFFFLFMECENSLSDMLHVRL